MLRPLTELPKLSWIETRGMRNKTIHDYFDVDLTVVWATIKEDLPQLKQLVDSLLTEYRRDRQL